MIDTGKSGKTDKNVEGGVNPRPKRPLRQKKADRLLMSKQTQEEILCDYALAPFDEAVRQMDYKWGVDRLVELVSVETAQKFGSALYKMNDAIYSCDPAMTAARAQVCIKGLAAMDAEATAAGKEPASDEVWIIEADGVSFGLMKDGRAWPRAKERYPGIELITEREVVFALIEYKQSVVKQSLDVVKQSFPNAELTAVRKKTKAKEIEDDIPF